MSCPPSRPSIDLGTSQLRTPILATEDKALKVAPRPTPSRLQHSPSLPNIWFPPHSGPIPSEMSKAEGTRLQRPSAPPSPKLSPSNVSSEKEHRALNRHVKYASIDPVTTKDVTLKTHARRRTERDQPHSLLTPPLTPSSSIQTSASHESSNSANPSFCADDTAISEEIRDPDSDSTRILLLENVHRKLSVEKLKSAIIGSLVAHCSEKQAVDDHTGAPILTLLRGDPLKGVNGRHLFMKGMIPVVFFDARVARVAKEVLMDRNVADLQGCIGDELDDQGERRWLSARLVTVDELSKASFLYFFPPSRLTSSLQSLGYSSFLDGVNGTFSLTLELAQKSNGDSKEKTTSLPTESTTQTGFDIKIDAEEGTICRGQFNISIVQNIVKSFGAIRSFQFVRHDVDHENSPILTYDVEYYDSREAATAFEDLQDKIMFGMKIRTTRKAATQLSDPSQGTPFPSIPTPNDSSSGLGVASPVPRTQSRRRFIHSRKDAISKVEVGEGAASPQLSPRGGPAGAPSPPVFYTATPPFAELSGNAPVSIGQGSGRSPGLTQQTHLQGQPWPDSDQTHPSCVYAHDGACLYCPSRGPGPVPYTPSYTHYAMSPTTPGAIYYPAPTGIAQIPNMANVAPIPNQGAFMYEYADPHQLQPILNAGAWGFDPAIAAVGPGPLPLMGTNIASPVPFSLRDDLSPSLAGHLYQGYLQAPDQDLGQAQGFADNTSKSSAILSQAIAHITSPDSTPVLRYDPSTLVNGSPSQTPGLNDRNQLNIARIEEGLDTRTTVMIKNIPNKMSDLDLTDYIAKVCPRRIDFLYLRMDFKNGCNVGYAFVNFITVEDLLLFAKERLGAKW
ncbi:hypothetical protein CVT26_006628 [Gymnopilus dilepis]|uniref:Mei2-like C-terminal RNA recognition motif domain-containing protein n=1 Tax=Gymnopilus dilepis TaxID=231916 RepID=A0A409Y2X0_9AGAR|nr:hypothetical protein CVT26_006628 [Gymnopilus dilepis]